MAQPTRPYSARDAIANALYAYQCALEACEQREQRARAEYQSAEQNARQQYQGKKQQLLVWREAEKKSVQQILAEANDSLTAAESLIAQAGLTKRIVVPNHRQVGAGQARPSKQEIQSCFARIRSSEASLRHEVQVFEKYQQTFFARLMNTLGLGP